MEFFDFLAKKLRGHSLKLLLRLEVESLLVGLTGWVPTTFGLFLRAGMAKLIFKRSGFCWIQPRVIFVHGERITIGKSCAFNSGTYINGLGGITMGDHVLIGSNVTISSGMHPIEGQQPPVFSRQSIPKPIVIGDDVWIGAGAVIMPGVTLASGSVIGANAVVTRDTEAYGVYAGVPAKLLRTR